MGKSQETFSKKENEKKKIQKRKDKQEKKEQRKENSMKGKGLDDMLAYVDENGNITTTPPDPKKRREINTEDIRISTHRQEAVDPTLPRTGVVTFFNESKGYGFIKDSQSGESIFVHINSVIGTIKENNIVSFKVEQGQKGPTAVEVSIVK